MVFIRPPMRSRFLKKIFWKLFSVTNSFLYLRWRESSHPPIRVQSRAPSQYASFVKFLWDVSHPILRDQVTSRSPGSQQLFKTRDGSHPLKEIFYLSRLLKWQAVIFVFLQHEINSADEFSSDGDDRFFGASCLRFDTSVGIGELSIFRDRFPSSFDDESSEHIISLAGDSPAKGEITRRIFSRSKA